MQAGAAHNGAHDDGDKDDGLLWEDVDGLEMAEEELLQWTRALDFGQYHDHWQSLATSAPSESAVEFRRETETLSYTSLVQLEQRQTQKQRQKQEQVSDEGNSRTCAGSVSLPPWVPSLLLMMIVVLMMLRLRYMARLILHTQRRFGSQQCNPHSIHP